jgi:putative spermidine/putrescine transport system permease protein
MTKSRVILGLVAVIVGIWLVAPTLIVIPMSFTGIQSFRFPPPSWSTEWYSRFVSDPDWYTSVLHSLVIAGVATIAATTLGTAAAFGLVRGRLPGKRAVTALLLAPMIVPVVILAIGVYAVFLTWHLTGSFMGFMLALTALALPFPVVTVSASLQNMDRSLEAAAANLGANRLATFRRVTLPLILPGVLAGALFAFATAVDDVVVSLFLSTPTLRTLPVQMYLSVTEQIDPTIAAASTLIMGLNVMVLLLVLRVRGWAQRMRRQGA